VELEVRHRHHPRHQEGDRPGEQPEDQQDAADQFEDATDADLAHQFERSAGRGRKAEDLLGPVLQEHEARDNAQCRQGQRAVTLK